MNVQVIVCAPTRFHAFDLAVQLAKRNMLAALFTAYPRWKVDGVLRPWTRSLAWLAAPILLSRRLHRESARREVDWWIKKAFDRAVARRLPAANGVVTLSGFGLEVIRTAKKRGMLAVCDRGSTHILFQDEILREEFERWGIPYRGIDRRVIDKELREYDEADLITVPSSFAFRTFVTKGLHPEKLAVVPYGVDLDLFHPLPGETTGRFRVLFVGHVSLQKGVQYLLEAVAPLRKDVELWLVGSISAEVLPILRRYEGAFRAMGPVPRAELRRYYSAASVLVLPSLQEGLALVQAQAMACGVPVIGTPNTGAEDLFDDGVEGFIVPVRSPDAIREKILYLKNHPEVRLMMSQAARKRVQTLGGWTTYGDRVVAAYERAYTKVRKG